MKSTQVIFILLLCSAPMFADGFLKVSGKYIVNDKNEEVLLRGIGLGSWLVPEGYMLQTSNFANAGWEIKNKIIGVVGQQNADSFWTAFRKNFVTRKDVEWIAQLGFNSVRLPMHWEFFINPSGGWRAEGFTIIDSLLRQCADNNIYLILDLHAAPGGQSASDISDYNPASASLWANTTNKTKTINLWKKIAERCKNEPWIGGYDILNEPAWDLGAGNVPLRELYIAITNAIREVDSNHIIFVEGNWYATDFKGMTPPWDKNMVYSFHKYWNTNDISSINYLITLRETTNRPLWLGESGENSNVWFNDCITLMESNKIGWAWWTLKKFDAIAGPFSVPTTTEYNLLLQYWKGQNAKPSVNIAVKGLMDMANRLKLEHCIFRPDVIDALLRQPNDASTKPFTSNIIPGKIFLVDYDLGKIGIAYNDTDYHNIQGQDAVVWNNGWMYRNDGVDIEECSDTITNGYNVGWTASTEFLFYTVNVMRNGKYSIDLRVAATVDSGLVGLSIDGKNQVLKQIAKTGGKQTWSTQNIMQVNLTAGAHTFKLVEYSGGFNLNYLDVTYAGTMDVR